MKKWCVFASVLLLLPALDASAKKSQFTNKSIFKFKHDQNGANNLKAKDEQLLSEIFDDSKRLENDIQMELNKTQNAATAQTQISENVRKKRLQILPYHQSSDHQGGAGFPTFNFAGFEAFSSQIRNTRHPTDPSDSIEVALAPINDDQVQPVTKIFDNDHNFGDFTKIHSMKKTVSEELNERPR